MFKAVSSIFQSSTAVESEAAASSGEDTSPLATDKSSQETVAATEATASLPACVDTETEKVTDEGRCGNEDDDNDNSLAYIDSSMTEDVQLVALVQLHVALENIASDDKAAYLHALQTCPELVETESDPWRFLRFHRLDPWAAAQRLCRYWSLRQRVFGPDRYTRPLNLSPEGAFDVDDVEFLQYGTWAMLPPDAEGRVVAFIDRNRIPCHYGQDRDDDPLFFQTRTSRSAFLHHHLISLHPQTATKGWVALLVHSERQALKRAHQKLLEEIFDMLPLRRYQVAHAVVYSHRRHYFLDTLLPQIMSRILPYLRRDVRVHVLRQPQQTCAQLVMSGAFLEQGVPTELGGQWDFARFNEMYQTMQLPGSRFAYDAGGHLIAESSSEGPSSPQQASPEQWATALGRVEYLDSFKKRRASDAKNDKGAALPLSSSEEELPPPLNDDDHDPTDKETGTKRRIRLKT